jgi:diguanylate cyclase (GGDEF)-like protein
MSYNLRQKLADLIYPEGKNRRDRAERLAQMDDLTGLANRRAFDRALPSVEADRGICVISFDVNNFKTVNDSAGHLAGDAALRQVADALTRSAARFGYGERVFRTGGDEFAIFAPAHLADALRDECEFEFGRRIFGERVVSISGSIGATYAEADAGLQERKAAEKSRK